MATVAPWLSERALSNVRKPCRLRLDLCDPEEKIQCSVHLLRLHPSYIISFFFGNKAAFSVGVPNSSLLPPLHW